jgi:hypothetical protein
VGTVTLATTVTRTFLPPSLLRSRIVVVPGALPT